MEVANNISYTSAQLSTPLIGLTLHQLLEQRVREHPDREMYVYVEDNERVTFKEFKDRVENLAAGLISMGMKKGDKLATWSNIHMEFVLCVAAARSIGVVTVRIRPTFANFTVQDILLRTKAKVLVLGRTPSDSYSKLDDIKATADKTNGLPYLDFVIGVGENNKSGTYSVCEIEELGSNPIYRECFNQMKNDVKFDDDSDMFGTSVRGQMGNPPICECGIEPQTMQHLMQCSRKPATRKTLPGSTGYPKLVVHTHFSIINGSKTFLYYMDNMPDKANRKYLARNSNHISGEMTALMPPLVAGITTVLPASVYSIDTTLETIQNERLTDAAFLITDLYDFANYKDVDRYDISSFSACYAGGSNIPLQLVETSERNHESKVMIAYGSTEMMMLTGSMPWDPVEIRYSAGKPLSNVEIQVVDVDGKCLPIGTVGDVWCRCPGRFKEYFGNEERTREDITPQGWFKSGDLGVLDESGILTIIARKQDMISKGGANLLPAHIEDIISQHPSVDQVQVIGVPDDRLGEELCACIRTRTDQKIDVEQMVTYLTGKVEGINLPGYVLTFDCFPKTDVGKIDRKMLTKQAIHRIESDIQS